MKTHLIGMMGPATPRELVDYLPPGTCADDMPPGIGGTPVNLLTRELLRRGRRVALFTLDPKATKELILRGPQLTICILPWRAQGAARDFFAAERESLLKAVLREKPALLHAQWTYEYALAGLASGLPIVMTAHDAPWNVLRHNFIPYRMARTVMAYMALSRAKRVVSVAPYVAEHLKRYMLYRGPKLVIPNGMPSKLFESAPYAERSINGATFGASLVGWSGYKNGEVLIEAFARVRSALPQARLVLFGSGHARGEAAEQWANARGNAAGIEFAGQVTHVELLSRLASEISVLVHPALEEAQPMALIEAMALGIPVIAGERSGGVPWTLDEGRAGILVDVTNPDQIAQAMLKLATDDSQRKAWGDKGHSFAKQRFHIRSVADAWEAQYEQTFT
jgi:glycosyltransferase involved in cell wall biosynthesis